MLGQVGMGGSLGRALDVGLQARPLWLRTLEYRPNCPTRAQPWALALTEMRAPQPPTPFKMLTV